MTIDFNYKFEFSDMYPLEFHVCLDQKSGKLQFPPNLENEDWTKLDFQKCGHCPLKSQDQPNCPVAVGLGHLVQSFGEMKSFWKTHITVTTSERTYVKDTDVQTGLFSLFGLIMASSGCPHLDFLRPMARYHLPFSSMDETLVRVASMYLLKQYFNAKSGQPTDMELKKLDELYKNVTKVNQGILARIRQVGRGDSKANAVLILDSFAFLFSSELSNDLSSVRETFASQ
ncbi:MAG: hypothetical protein IT288_12375 [Bdellovibrionales bacterium]|nr:hypothetical protein [Bdellovibrionales bacterium]